MYVLAFVLLLIVHLHIDDKLVKLLLSAQMNVRERETEMTANAHTQRCCSSGDHCAILQYF